MEQLVDFEKTRVQSGSCLVKCWSTGWSPHYQWSVWLSPFRQRVNGSCASISPRPLHPLSRSNSPTSCLSKHPYISGLPLGLLPASFNFSILRYSSKSADTGLPTNAAAEISFKSQIHKKQTHSIINLNKKRKNKTNKVTVYLYRVSVWMKYEGKPSSSLTWGCEIQATQLMLLRACKQVVL